MVGNPDFTRRSLSKGAKVVVRDERHGQLYGLEREGQMFRCASWGRVLMGLSDEYRNIAIYGAMDTLPHNARNGFGYLFLYENKWYILLVGECSAFLVSGSDPTKLDTVV